MEPFGLQLVSLASRDEGQDLIEYALLASLISITVILAIGDAGTHVARLWANIAAGIATP